MSTILLPLVLQTLWSVRLPQDYRQEKVSEMVQQLERLASQHEYHAVIELGLEFQEDFESSADVAYEMGLAARLLGEVEQARQYYDRVIELDSKHAAARYDRGEILLTLGDVEGAKKDFRVAAEQVPDHWGVHYRLAHIACLEVDPQHLELHLDRAVAHGLDFQVLIQDGQWRLWAKHPVLGTVLKMVFLRYSTESVWHEMERAQ